VDNLGKALALREGVAVFIVLALLTILEFWVGAATSWTGLLILIALFKAAIVIQYYMHLRRVTSSEEGDH
jgi:heme/copper-type cytochrome/quinol oxidase subunit 4